jgi:2-aminoadipate transaminase
MVLRYSDRMSVIKPSIMREFGKTTSRPDIISFAAGMPASELFPVAEIKKAMNEVLEDNWAIALQYGPAEGFLPLREKIARNMQKAGVNATADQILIISGSQQGLEFCGKIFLNPGDAVICESPTYLGATDAFITYQSEFVDVPLDDRGMKLDELENVLRVTPQAKMIYTVPDFQNPTGISWSLDRRKQFIELANKYNIAVIEDNPYGELRFEGDKIPAIKSLDTDGRVIFLGTFSKTLCPGLRMGWICADAPVLDKFLTIKHTADLQTNTLEQMVINRLLDIFDYDTHIAKIRALYKKRRDLMVGIIKEKFPPEIKFVSPEGGLFIWLELPEHIDTVELMEKAAEKKVSFVPGLPFFAKRDRKNFIRLNYSSMTEDRIIKGMDILAEVMHEAIR